MSEAQKQSQFDATMARFANMGARKESEFGFIIALNQIEDFIEAWGLEGTLFAKILRSARDEARARGYSDNFRVRLGDYSSTGRNATIRSGVRAVESLAEKTVPDVKSLKRKKMKKKAVSLKKDSLSDRITKIVRRLGRMVTSTEVAKKAKCTINEASSVLSNKKLFNKRKAKKSEKTHSNTMYVYGVAA